MKNSNRNKLKMTTGRSSNDADNNRDTNIMMTILLLERSPRIGRDKLAEQVGVGRGYIRTVLSKLSASGLTDTFQTGCTLSNMGQKVLRHIPISIIDGVEYLCSDNAVQKAVLLKGASESVTSGMFQRDMGLKSGGSGCITFVFTGDRLLMPPDTDLSISEPALYNRILESVKMEEGDVIIIGEGDDDQTALRSAVNAAMHSMKKPCLPNI